MKNEIYYLALTLVFSLIACKQNESQLDNLLKLDETLRVVDTRESSSINSGIIPSGHPLLIMRSRINDYSWSDFYNFFKEELSKDENEHYFDNLEWLNLSLIISKEEFNDEASFEIKEELWQRMKLRKVINQPQIAFEMLQSIRKNLQEKEYANRLHTIKLINEKHLANNPEEFHKHFNEMYREVYQEMEDYKYDTLGNPLFDID